MTEVRRPAGPTRTTSDHEPRLHLPQATGLLTLVFFAAGAMAQNHPSVGPTPSEKMPAVSPKISYVDGELRISVLDSTLADILAKVAGLTGVKIDLPAGANSERMPVVELGPGPAREVLASLLSDSNFDYLIQASVADPDKIESVLVLKREKKGPGGNGTDMVRPGRAAYASAAAANARSEEPPPVPDNPVPVQPEVAAAQANPLNAPPEMTQLDQSTPLSQSQPAQSNVPKTFPVSPPATLDQQSISQQLQQMYGQRMQMNQQAAQPVSPANPGNR